jgi:peptide/nickel transport system substrate-binding protein
MITRRSVLLGPAVVALPTTSVHAQPRVSIAVRTERDVEVLDPAFRSGLQDGNIIRAVFQRLYTIAPGSGELVPDAASELKQASPTVIEFTLKPGQTFTRGFGEMTAEDVKFSYERFEVSVVTGIAAITS